MIAFLLAALVVLACRAPARSGRPAATPTPAWTAAPGPSMPAAVANNAVAAITVDGHEWLFSFMGIGAGKDFRSITRRAYALDVKGGRWEPLPDVPGPVGRIAATAQTLGDRVYLFGGYSVAEDGKETTSQAVDIYDVRDKGYSRGADIPVPVDDSVSGVWRDRLIFLVGGWSVSNNVAAVQIYDPASDRWMAGSPILGAPVFGHAGGIARDVIVYCGGAREQAPQLPKYVVNPECYRGDINPADPAKVIWRRIANHPGPSRYRAAAGPVEAGGVVGVMFVGGTSNPYNYNGTGYDQRPSEPEATTWIYDIERDAWVEGPRLGSPSMDHRGLVGAQGAWWTIGGFGAGQAVSAAVTRLSPPG